MSVMHDLEFDGFLSIIFFNRDLEFMNYSSVKKYYSCKADEFTHTGSVCTFHYGLQLGLSEMHTFGFGEATS